ncbi:Ca-activated chloride channel family protein [Pseudonocardia hierapolitana]|uniref:Ca-activated chloride channel family protein n=1 Tax=Pseudonocardia hierapolitana TaxID=1128676 RepID=A0A561SP08_9PSEU|nr:extracellular solute-binding protein [Pseudonocardia hierapolitana]TWF76599.1 Ca-activated chloride channel family protein [Pseudonocardia hierapolitana]
MRAVRRIAVVAAVLALVAGCGGDGGGGDGPGLAVGPSDAPVTLRVLAGSELLDLEPVLAEAGAATGVRIELDPVGTLDGAEAVASGTAEAGHDAIWFSSNRYLALQPAAQARLGTATDIMSSPVVLGLRRSVAERLGWVGRPVTWAEISAAAGARQFTYGMTDPSASNSGFSAVVAVATALAGAGSALTREQAESTVPALRDFFAAQTLAAGSSGFLQEAYVRRATGADPGEPVDGLINYESVLEGMNAAGTVPEPLELVRPADGVVTADYPFTVLAAASPEAKDAHRRLAEHLRTPDVQRAIAERTHRRPAVPGVLPAPAGTAVELPFPAQADVVDALLTSYFDKLRRPSRTIYVLDTSGSMAGDERIGALRRSLAGLAGADPSLTGQYRRFRGREQVTLLPFSTGPGSPQTFTVAEDDPGPDRQRIADAGAALQPDGGTAIYDGLQAAYRIAEQQIAADPDRFTSIVLMTDGENTSGADIEAFRLFAGARPAALREVPVFCVLFGETDAEEMEEVARLTGGRTFDARTAPLAEVFKEIRGYV